MPITVSPFVPHQELKSPTNATPLSLSPFSLISLFSLSLLSSRHTPPRENRTSTVISSFLEKYVAWYLVEMQLIERLFLFLGCKPMSLIRRYPTPNDPDLRGKDCKIAQIVRVKDYLTHSYHLLLHTYSKISSNHFKTAVQVNFL